MKDFIIIGIKDFNDLYYKIDFSESLEGHKKQIAEVLSFCLDNFIKEEMKQNRKNLDESFYFLGQFLKNEDVFDWRNCSLSIVNVKQKNCISEFIINLN